MCITSCDLSRDWCTIGNVILFTQCSLAQVSTRLFQKCVPLSDSTVSEVLCDSKTLFPSLNTVFHAVPQGTGSFQPSCGCFYHCKHMGLATQVWGSVIQSTCQASLYFYFSHNPSFHRGLTHLAWLITERAPHSFVTCATGFIIKSTPQSRAHLYVASLSWCSKVSWAHWDRICPSAGNPNPPEPLQS